MLTYRYYCNTCTDKRSHFSCSVTSLSSYFPTNFGTMLTLEVAVIRCYLAVNAANCVYPSSVKVLVAALSSFTIYAGLYLAYVSALVYQDVPYSYMIEHCSRSLTKMRPISKGALLSLQIPNVLNVVTLIVDLVLVQFLRKNSLKDIQNQITLGAIIPPDANGGKFAEFDFKEFF